MFDNLRAIVIASVAMFIVAGDVNVSAEELNRSLADYLAQASKSKRFESLGQQELQRAEALFARTLARSESFDRLRTDWGDLGWELFELETDLNTSRLLVLMESPTERRGRGFFAFRSVGLPIVVQAPHSFYDKHTRRIALELFQDERVGAVAWNTVRRSTIDVAHAPYSYLNAFTRAVLRVQPQTVVVQLHGFATDKRQTLAGRSSDVIVSDGTRLPGLLPRGLQADLRSTVAPATRLFPVDVQELGGTKNRQGEILRRFGSDRFVHVEMANGFRGRLRSDKELRDRFQDALIRSLTRLASPPSSDR